MRLSGALPAHATPDDVVRLTIEKSRLASMASLRVVPPAVSVHVPALSSWVMEASPLEATTAAVTGARPRDTAASSASSIRDDRRRINSWLSALHGLDHTVAQRFSRELHRG
jgi:hypothetical protein